MTVYRGTTAILDIRRGSTLINEVRRGSTIVWQRATATTIDFTTMADAADLGAAWTSHGPSSDFLIGVENGTARVKLPDGLVGGFFDLRTSRMRFTTATAPADDGFIEVVAASRGSSGSLLNMSDGDFQTVAFSRLSNSGFTHGVGIDMAGGNCWITRMVSSTLTRMADGGSFVAGNRLHLAHANRLHTLYRNGFQVAQWNDTGNTASKGSDYRSMGLLAEAGKDLLGPRRFSPALSSIKMG